MTERRGAIQLDRPPLLGESSEKGWGEMVRNYNY